MKRVFVGIGWRLGQEPVLEYTGTGWLLWLAYSKGLTAGTYLKLLPDGEIVRQTEQPDGSISEVVTIKPKARDL